MPQRPVIFIVDDEPHVLNAVERDLRARYGPKYRTLKATSGESALEMLSALMARHEQVALLMSDQRMPMMEGTEFLAEACKIYGEARRVLLTAYADTQAAIASINQVGLDYYLVKPWDPPEEKLYPVLDELLSDWQATVRLPSMRVKGVMTVRVVRIRSTATLQQAVEMVALSGASDLMVVDKDREFLGVLSEGDILRAALPDIDEILAAGGSLDDAFELFLRKGTHLSDRPIMPLVIQEPLTVDPDDHVAKAATLLVNRQIRRLPVLKENRLVGTISRAEICQAIVGAL
jgi:CBS domain-containing protein/FixJ family two-component response regulator